MTNISYITHCFFFILGDGTREEPLVIRGDKLNSVDEIVREAESEKNRELKPVSETKTRLTERIYHLEEGGQTALGPAILFALSIASKRHGSRIVVCTDGNSFDCVIGIILNLSFLL